MNAVCDVLYVDVQYFFDAEFPLHILADVYVNNELLQHAHPVRHLAPLVRTSSNIPATSYVMAKVDRGLITCLADDTP
jgi:hypothetical protein